MLILDTDKVRLGLLSNRWCDLRPIWQHSRPVYVVSTNGNIYDVLTKYKLAVAVFINIEKVLYFRTIATKFGRKVDPVTRSIREFFEYYV